MGEAPALSHYHLDWSDDAVMSPRLSAALEWVATESMLPQVTVVEALRAPVPDAVDGESSAATTVLLTRVVTEQRDEAGSCSTHQSIGTDRGEGATDTRGLHRARAPPLHTQ